MEGSVEVKCVSNQKRFLSPGNILLEYRGRDCLIRFSAEEFYGRKPLHGVICLCYAEEGVTGMQLVF